jgi:hypothetical protein
VQFASSAYRFDPNANNPTNSYYAIITYGNEGNVTGQLATHFQTGETFTRAYNSSWSAWRTQLDSSNYTSYSPSLTGSGASGTWSINVTGNAATAGGLAVHNTQGTQNSANQIVRTQNNGYTMLGWINTTSGDNGTTAINRIYASDDDYIRYYTPANFRSGA